MKILLMAMVLVGSVGWAEDEDSDTVVNAISSGSGVNYKVGRAMYLTDKGLFYRAGNGTYVGRDGGVHADRQGLDHAARVHDGERGRLFRRRRLSHQDRE